MCIRDRCSERLAGEAQSTVFKVTIPPFLLMARPVLEKHIPWWEWTMTTKATTSCEASFLEPWNTYLTESSKTFRTMVPSIWSNVIFWKSTTNKWSTFWTNKTPTSESGRVLMESSSRELTSSLSADLKKHLNYWKRDPEEDMSAPHAITKQVQGHIPCSQWILSLSLWKTE